MSLIVRTDVTAVKFYKNYILAGIGSTINIFQKQTAALLFKLQGLYGQKIYGFVILNSGGKILVYGGKQFTIISIRESVNIRERDRPEGIFTRCFDPVICDDWIHSGIWIDHDAVALLTAHNVLQLWNVSTRTLISEDASKDNSILYSGLLLPLEDGVLVMAGTVFSEVIIHKSGDNIPLHRLKGHKGVIFSISCDPQQTMIVTTSDDRSVRIWNSSTKPNYSYNTTDYWKRLNLVCEHELYGHSARVMRSCITSKNIISVGEDSAICYWDCDGKLAKKIITHQNGCIWSVDADKDNLVTGGGDCGIILHPLTVHDGLNDNIHLDIGTVKKVLFTARNNLVILNDINGLAYYNLTNKSVDNFELKHTSSYKMLTMSTCKQLIAVGDRDGKFDVFVENCKDKLKLVNIIDTKLQIDKVFSLHWAGNRHLIVCTDNGQIIVLASKMNSIEVYADFELPYCKERWLTSCAIDSTNNIFVLGDRCGNIHIYVKGKVDPIKSFKKVHGSYGATSINIKNSEITTTGRDGSIKYFHYNTLNCDYKYMGCKELHFQWIEKILDKRESLICGFQERSFVVYKIKDNSKLIEVPCGGGHRSWDAIRIVDKINDKYDEIIKFIYLKNSSIHIKTYQMSKILSTSLVNGSHSKEINCLKTYKCELDNSDTFFFSGGEDTTLRISRIDSELKFDDDIIFKQLSTVRTLKIHNIDKDNLLLISAGGRAQINIRNITFSKSDKLIVKSEELANYQIKGTDKERKGNQTWRNCTVDFDPETRLMDLDVIGKKNEFTIFCGCSDSKVRVLEYDNINNMLKLTKELTYHKTCVLKTCCFELFENDLLITATTRGEIAFWDVNDVNNDLVNPFFTTKTNKSGINSLDLIKISDKEILLATAGDDNAIHLVLLKITNQNDLSSMIIKDQWSSDKYHGSQISGLRLIDNLLISTSIDQRITVFQWDVGNNVSCDFLSQTYSDIADIQGLDVLESLRNSIKLCVFGKGMEVVEISKT